VPFLGQDSTNASVASVGLNNKLLLIIWKESTEAMTIAFFKVLKAVSAAGV
jgi:hypothetical protein